MDIEDNHEKNNEEENESNDEREEQDNTGKKIRKEVKEGDIIEKVIIKDRKSKIFFYCGI